MTRRPPHRFTLIELLIVIAIIAILAAIAVPDFLEGDWPTPVSRVKSDLRTLTTALEAYYQDQGAYPASTFSIEQQSGLPSAGSTFRAPTATLAGLTTPVAYLTELPVDPFAARKGVGYRYYSDGKGWIAGSPGRDGQASLPWDGAIAKLYDSSLADPQLPLLAAAGPHGAYTYDPTNGTISAGDIWRVAAPQPKKAGP